MHDIVHHRLVNQQLVKTIYATPHEIVSHFGAIQAQDYLGALWAIGLRLKNATESQIEKAIIDRTIIRTWPMRGTLHFVAAEDAVWMLQLLTPRVIANAAGRFRDLELDENIFAKSRMVFTKALQGGKHLPRKDMMELLDTAGITTAGQRGIHILGRLAQEGTICFGPRVGKQHTFVLLHEWVPKPKQYTREEALGEITKRYFISHGPATIQDFVWWSGLRVSEAKEGIALVGSRLHKEIIEGKEYWMKQSSSLEKIGKHIHMLPGFDEYIVAYKDRSAVLDVLHNQKINPGLNGMLSPTIVVDGEVVGTWKRTFKKNAVIVHSTYFGTVSKKIHESIGTTAATYAAFLNMPLVVS